MEKRQHQDEYMPDVPISHKGAPPRPQPDGINPQNPGSMPRGEDDESTKKTSPEFNDPPGAPWTPGRRG
jgi:hypothetical protein